MRVEELKFPIKLHKLLQEVNGETDSGKDLSNIICWNPDGMSFRILDKKRFESDVMPLYFDSARFKTFQRSLNLWGFLVRNKPNSSAREGVSDRYHKLFQRDRPELCDIMQRFRVKQPGARSVHKKKPEKSQQLNLGPASKSEPSPKAITKKALASPSPIISFQKGQKDVAEENKRKQQDLILQLLLNPAHSPAPLNLQSIQQARLFRDLILSNERSQQGLDQMIGLLKKVEYLQKTILRGNLATQQNYLSFLTATGQTAPLNQSLLHVNHSPRSVVSSAPEITTSQSSPAMLEEIKGLLMLSQSTK